MIWIVAIALVIWIVAIAGSDLASGALAGHARRVNCFQALSIDFGNPRIQPASAWVDVGSTQLTFHVKISEVGGCRQRAVHFPCKDLRWLKMHSTQLAFCVKVSEVGKYVQHAAHVLQQDL